jgi:ABC-type transporter Mla subunit MlaD
MANSRTNGSASVELTTTEAEPGKSTSEALRLAQAAEAAAAKVRARLDEISRVMADLMKINAVFESVADRLANATFRASVDATRGVAPRAVLVAFVEELADLARRTSEGTREIRKELRNYAATAGVTALALRQAETALQGLLGVLEQMAERQARAGQPIRIIEIETRVPPSPQMTVAALAKAVAAGGWLAEPPKSGGYKN